MTTVIGVDTSTQSCKVEIRDVEGGRVLGIGTAPHPRTSPPCSEQDPKAWWQAFTAALAAALLSPDVDSSEIAAISVAGQCHGLVALDEDMAVLRPAKLWNDTTSGPQATAMVADLGAAAWVDAVGSTPTAAFTITKLAWLAHHEPENLRRLRTVLLPHDWMTYRLTGRRITDRSEASGTGYFAAAEMTWRLDLLERFVDADLDWSAMLPEVLGPVEPAGQILPAVADLLGLQRSVTVGPGAGDQHAGALGLGLNIGDVAYSLGTSGVVLTPAEDPIHDHSGWVDGVADAAGGYLPLVCTLNAAKVTDKMAELLATDHNTLSDLALLAPADPDRPVLAAFLDGERSPSAPRARGVLAGLTSDTTREQLARSAFEGVLLGLDRGHRALQSAGVPADGAIVVTGGAARSAAYPQLLADLRQQVVTIRDVDNATTAGACIQAAAICRGEPIATIREEWRPGTSAEYEPRLHDADIEGLRDRYVRVAQSSSALGEPIGRNGHV